jgi:hypothetical protein
VGQIGAWAPIYQSQVHRLYASGLIQESSYIYFGVNGNEQLFSLPENVIVQRNKNIKEETDTLVSLKNFASKNPDYKILYFHTKGVSRNTLQTNAWRLFMEYFVIDKWKQCVEYLNEYDCCGTDYRLAEKLCCLKDDLGGHLNQSHKYRMILLNTQINILLFLLEIFGGLTLLT